MKNLLISLFLVFVCTHVASAATWNASQVADIIAKVNDTWQANHPKQERSFWDPAVYHTGNMEACMLFNATDRKETAKRWQEYSIAWGEQNQWMGAREKDSSKWKYKKYGEGMDFVLFGDWQICFQTYLDLYGMDPAKNGGTNDKRIARAFEVMDHEVNSGVSDYWWWADALYMVMPVFTKLYKQSGDVKYLDQMYANWQYANSIMYDNETGLYFRDGKYVYPKHKTNAGKKDFWARGDGWVLAAFAKVLKDTPKKYKNRKEILKYYKRMAKAVIDCQQPEGYWTRSMYDAEQAPGPETSGTALFCYGLFWGINNGVLPAKKYLPAAEKAWEYLATVALQPDGTVGYVQPIGEKAIPGQIVNQRSVTNFGTGAFLLAACEYYRWVAAKGGKDKNFKPGFFVGVSAGVSTTL